MPEGTLNANAETYAQAGSLPPPPPIPSDVPPEVKTWIEMATATLFGAANLGDPEDIAKAEKNHAEREAMTGEAADKFPANDEQQAQGMDQMAQQLPQMMSSVAGAVTGALGGALQPFMQMPQQLAQAAQGLMQSGMGAFQSGAGGISPDEFALDGLEGFDDFGTAGGGGGGAGGDLGAGGGGGSAGGGGGGIGTTPMSMLGPPATPASATATVPTAGRVAAPPAAVPTPAHATTPAGGMGGMGMMPPGMHGAGAGASDKDKAAATKRVSVPSVRNGAPVQGRITTPPPAPVVTKLIDDKKIATRRIVIPGDKTGKAEDAPEKRPDN